ncbi:MAG: LacI family transcriptional regulator [Anaerolineae bacterium]|nr:LacI family transcriptional regulator [Anaerolineae bacterium]
MPTIKDVARRAGVAPITASRVINDSGYVRESTRRRVEDAIDALGYVPNRIARSLRSKRTHTLALVLSDIANPFWTTVARGVEDVANGAGFSVILCNTDESPIKEDSYVRPHGPTARRYGEIRLRGRSPRPDVPSAEPRAQAHRDVERPT